MLRYRLVVVAVDLAVVLVANVGFVTTTITFMSIVIITCFYSLFVVQASTSLGPNGQEPCRASRFASC